MFARGKRHLIAAPKKSGKSLVELAHFMRMALAGERVAILDRENGGDEYARRLNDIATAWALTDEQLEVFRANLLYYEYPRLRENDAEELVRHLAEDLEVDLVCFDSQRMYLADFGLKEDKSDDYAGFMAYAIDPLSMAGVTTIILDNTGHENEKRPRGTVAKGDLNEIIMHLEVPADFDRRTRGRVRLVIDDSRIGERGSWEMIIGDGVFGEWVSLHEQMRRIVMNRPDFRDAVQTVLTAAGKPMGVNRLLKQVREQQVRIGDQDARDALKGWAQDPDSGLVDLDSRGYEFKPLEGVEEGMAEAAPRLIVADVSPRPATGGVADG